MIENVKIKNYSLVFSRLLRNCGKSFGTMSSTDFEIMTSGSEEFIERMASTSKAVERMASNSKVVNRRPRPLPNKKDSPVSFETAREDSPPPRSRSRTNHTGADQPPPPEQQRQQQQRDDVVIPEDAGFRSNHPAVILILIFLGYVLVLFLVYLSFPKMKPEERKHVKLPWSMQEAKALANVLDRYTDKHYWTVLFAFALVYLFLQTFAIPGSIFLSIMSGFLFPFWTALFLVCFCSATGASGCYMLSWLVARPLVQDRFSEVIRVWTAKVNEERDNLLNFIIFLRITPILPNWLINIVAPQIGVPLMTFWIGSFIGVAPPSALAVQGGVTLNMLTSPTDHISWTSIIVLALIALGSLIPVLIRRLSQ